MVREGAPSRPSLGITKLLALCVPALISIALVFWNITSLGLSVWDEHTYTSTAKWFFGTKDAWFQIYEPLGFPTLLALFFRAFGIHDYVAIATSGLFAIATVVLVTVVGYKLFGFEVAFSAPILLSFMPLFLFWSRFALADMTFTFFFGASIVTAYWAMKSTRLRVKELVLAGVLFAITANIKYQGYLALLIPTFYVPFIFRTSRKLLPRRFLDHIKSIAIIYFPVLSSATLWLFVIGIGERLREPGLGTHLSIAKIFTAPTLRLISFTTLEAGINRFQSVVVTNTRGLHNFIPLVQASYYLQVLATWVPITILVLAILGLLRKNLRKGPTLFVGFWFLMQFFISSSLPIGFVRLAVPMLPPLALVAALGLTRLARFISTEIASRDILQVKIGINSSSICLLLLVVLFSSSLAPMIQAVAINHASYREAGLVLNRIAGNSTVLAESQTVIAFYHPVVFDFSADPEIMQDKMDNSSFLITDFIADLWGLGPSIQQLENQGRLVRIVSIRNELPDMIYLTDSLNYSQAALISHYITIYRVIHLNPPGPNQGNTAPTALLNQRIILVPTGITDEQFNPRKRFGEPLLATGGDQWGEHVWY